MKSITRLRGLVLVVLALIMSMSLVNAQDADNFVRVSLGNSDIPGLDPSLQTDTHSIQYIQSLFPALTILDEVTSVAKPAMATWELSEDGLTYTFAIEPDVPWVKYNTDSGAVEEVLDADGNVRYVVANDFVYGMTRSMDPRNGSYYGGVLSGWIVGGSDFNRSIDDAADDASEEDLAAMVDEFRGGLGFNVVDDYTLEITVPQPASFAVTLLGMWMSTAQPEWVIEEFGDVWTDPENIVSYGPFTLQEWLRGESATMIANPFWPGTEGVPVPQIAGVIDTFLDVSAALANYEAGSLDASGVPLPDLPRVQADADLSQELTLSDGQCSFYLGVNLTVAPTDDIRVRQALSMALDRQLIIDSIYDGIGEPAFYFSRPNLNAAPSVDSHPDSYLAEDLAAAQALMQEYVDEVGELPVITFGTSQSETTALVAAVMQEMWSDAFGDIFEAQVQAQEWAVFLETTNQPETAPNIWALGWCQDYPDANNFLYDVYHSSVIQDGSGFQNDEFDSLLEQAISSTDLEERQNLYARAEEILTSEVVAQIPYRYNSAIRLTKPYIDRPFGSTVTQFELWSINN